MLNKNIFAVYKSNSLYTMSKVKPEALKMALRKLGFQCFNTNIIFIGPLPKFTEAFRLI